MKTINDALGVYFKTIGQVPLLSSAEQLRMARLAKKGDDFAREQLVKTNLRFVVRMAKKYQGNSLPLIDLISEGNMGLLRAVESFDPERGFHFISYAAHWIKQNLIKAIAEKSYAVKLPLSWNNNLCQISRVVAKTDGMSFDQKVSFLADKTGLKKEEIFKLLVISQQKFSLDTEVSGEKGKGRSMGEFMSDQHSLDPQDSLQKDVLKMEMNKAISSLNTLEKDIILNRYGFCGDKVTTLEVLGKKYRLTKERIRQIEKNALKILKQRMYQSDIAAYLD